MAEPDQEKLREEQRASLLRMLSEAREWSLEDIQENVEDYSWRAATNQEDRLDDA